MKNYNLFGDKSLFDLFNMVNPNCYQAMIIQDIIEDNIDSAIENCKALQVAVEYYKWETKDKNADYIDSLICQSGLDKWQKIAIMHALGSDINKCIEYLESELKQRNKSYFIMNNTYDDPNDHERLLHESIMSLLHPSCSYPFWTKIPRCL